MQHAHLGLLREVGKNVIVNVLCRDVGQTSMPSHGAVELPFRHVPRAPPNTKFNSVLKYGLKMRQSPKFTPFYLNLGVLRELPLREHTPVARTQIQY